MCWAFGSWWRNANEWKFWSLRDLRLLFEIANSIQYWLYDSWFITYYLPLIIFQFNHLPYRCLAELTCFRNTVIRIITVISISWLHNNYRFLPDAEIVMAGIIAAILWKLQAFYGIFVYKKCGIHSTYSSPWYKKLFVQCLTSLSNFLCFLSISLYLS